MVNHSFIKYSCDCEIGYFNGEKKMVTCLWASLLRDIVNLEKILEASKPIQSKSGIALMFLKRFFVFTFKIETDYQG